MVPRANASRAEGQVLGELKGKTSKKKLCSKDQRTGADLVVEKRSLMMISVR